LAEASSPIPYKKKKKKKKKKKSSQAKLKNVIEDIL